MNYLLDTCVLSEFTRRKPEEKVIHWIDSIAEDQLFISVITIGEIQTRDRTAAQNRGARPNYWFG